MPITAVSRVIDEVTRILSRSGIQELTNLQTRVGKMTRDYTHRTNDERRLPARILCTDFVKENYPILAAFFKGEEEWLVDLTEELKQWVEDKTPYLVECTPWDDLTPGQPVLVWNKEDSKSIRIFAGVKRGKPNVVYQTPHITDESWWTQWDNCEAYEWQKV